MGYIPNWEDISSVAQTISRKQEWRTLFLGINKEDLTQEAWIVFYKCINKDNTYENKGNFIGYFKMAFINKITDLIKYKIDEKELTDTFAFESVDGQSYIDRIIELSENNTDYLAKLDKAPQEIKDIIMLLKILKLTKISNPILCNCLGYDSDKRDLLQEAKNYFQN